MPFPSIQCNFAIRADGSHHGVISHATDWARVHARRERAGFVAVGANTWNADHPRLLVSAERLGRAPLRQSVPVVFARHTVLKPPSQTSILPIVVARHRPTWPCRFVQAGELRTGLAGLASEGVINLFVEGGPKLHEAVVSCQIIDSFTVFVASDSFEEARNAVRRALPFLPPPERAERLDGGTLLEFRPGAALANVA